MSVAIEPLGQGGGPGFYRIYVFWRMESNFFLGTLVRVELANRATHIDRRNARETQPSLHPRDALHQAMLREELRRVKNMLRLAVIIVVSVASSPVARGQLQLFVQNVKFSQTRADFDLKFDGSLVSPTGPPVDPTMGFDSFTWSRLGGDPESPTVVAMSDELSDAFLVDPPGIERFWRFRLGITIADFDQNDDNAYDGVEDLVFRMDGFHTDGPHPDDKLNNELQARESRPVSRDVGQRIKRTISRSSWRHPLKTTGFPHRDKYSATFEFEVQPGMTIPLLRPGDVERNVHLFAEHRANSRVSRREAGITTEADLFFGFNVDSGQVFMSPDQFNTARRQPEDLPASNHEFPGDPFLGSFMGITPVTLVGLNADGLYEFTGGTMFLAPDVSRGGTYEFIAAFEAMFFDPAADVLFAILNDVDAGDEPGGAGFSPFMDQFVQQHLFTPGVEGIQLVAPVDLDGLTNGFTANHFGEGKIRLTGALVPEPASGMLLILCGALWTVAAARRLPEKSTRD